MCVEYVKKKHQRVTEVKTMNETELMQGKCGDKLLFITIQDLLFEKRNQQQV